MEEQEKIFCCYCGEVIKFKSLITQEHLLPQSKGGNNSRYNKRKCCKSCNNLRGNKDFDKWILELQLKRDHYKIYSKGLLYKLDAMIENAEYWRDYVKANRQNLLRPVLRKFNKKEFLPKLKLEDCNTELHM